MPKMIRIEKTIIDRIVKMSADLPVKEPSDYPLKESIEQLLPVIENLQNKGYSIEEISKIYTQNGLSVSATTLRQYLKDLNNKPVTETSKLIKTSKQSKPKTINPPTQELAPTDSTTESPPAEEHQISENKPRPSAKSGFNLVDMSKL
jgi:DNA-binding transcriptional MerR regulator